MLCVGTGSGGTIVYSGTVEGRACAVKRLVKQPQLQPQQQADAEIALLIDSDQHPNVLRYYAKVCIAACVCVQHCSHLL